MVSVVEGSNWAHQLSKPGHTHLPLLRLLVNLPAQVAGVPYGLQPLGDVAGEFAGIDQVAPGAYRGSKPVLWDHLPVSTEPRAGPQIGVAT